VLYQLSYLGPMANQAWLPVGGPQDTTALPRRATDAGPDGLPYSRPVRAA